ncbi:MAG TPA: hypothetical protein DCX06_01990 [Opitutae bacterium]|nr:hypothetical protein [Opitutae bacterium]
MLGCNLRLLTNNLNIDMKKILIICLLFPVSVSMLFSKSLKIANSVLFEIPAGWEYLESTRHSLSGLGPLDRAILKNSTRDQKLTVSVLSVSNPSEGVDYATALVDATLSPYIEVYRKQGNHYYPRKLLWRGNYLMYSQPVGRLNSRKVELRGILIKHGSNWVNFFCIGPREVSWEQYAELMNGTQLLKN